MIAGPTVAARRLDNVVNFLLPRLETLIECGLRLLYRCGEEIGQLIVLKLGCLMLQVAVPLRIAFLHLGLQRLAFFTNRVLLK